MFAEVWTGADYLWCHVNINNGHKNASKQTLLLIEGGKNSLKQVMWDVLTLDLWKQQDYECKLVKSRPLVTHITLHVANWL